MDRYSSTTLNRPFAISDKDISVNHPVNVNDDYILSGYMTDLDTVDQCHSPCQVSEMSVHLHCIKLRQISSLIHFELSQISKDQSRIPNESFLSSGKIYAMVESFLDKLDDWRRSAPIFDDPQCLFERQEWYDILQARESHHLVRKAVDLAPKRDGLPPRYLLTLCLQSANRVTSLYSELFDTSMITYTRSYFQMMFTAGLSALFCISVGAGLEPTEVEESRTTLSRCESTLKKVSRQLPDAAPYVTMFEALHRHIIQKANTGGLRSCGMSPSRISEDQLHNVDPWNRVHVRANLSQGSLHLERANSSHEAGDEPHVYQASDEGSAVNTLAPGDAFPINSDPLQWAFLTDDSLWNVGNYAYGDPNHFQGIFDGLDLLY